MDEKAVETLPGKKVRFGVFSAIALVFSAFFAFWVYRYAIVPPIDFNEAYNLQIAESLAKHFCYCTTYAPVRVFPVEESTNGIAQYVLAFFFIVTGNVDVAVASCAATATLAFLCALYFTRREAIFLAPALFVWWPMQTLVSIGFVGEIWSLALALAAIAAIGRDRAVAGAIFAGLAIESKLIVAFPLFLTVFGMLYLRAPAAGDVASISRKTLSSLVETAKLAAGALVVLCIAIAFSVLHSESPDRGLPAIGPTVMGFVANMAAQGRAEGAGGSAASYAIGHFSNPVVLACVAIAGAILLRRTFAFAPLVALSAIVFLFFGRSEGERHVLVFFDFVLVFGAKSLAELLEPYRFARPSASVARGIYAATAFCCAVFLTWPPSFVAGQQVAAGEDRERAVFANGGWYFYAPKLLDVLRKQPFIVASGWWQFPEITARYAMPQFYDRTSPANASLPPGRSTLFFDKTNRSWPVTTVAGNCGDVLYSEGPLVVCRPKAGESLAYQPAGGYPAADANPSTDPAVAAVLARSRSAAAAGTGPMLTLQAKANAGVSFVAIPSVVPAVVAGAPPAVALRWIVPNAGRIEIHMATPDGQLFTQSAGSGSAVTGPWVSAGAHFYLQDVTNGEPGMTVAVIVAQACGHCKRR